MSEQDEELPPQLPGECLEPPQLTTITDVDKDDLKQEYISAMDRFEGANMDTSTADMSLQSSMPSTSVNPFHPSFELENVTAVSVEQTPGINTVSVSPSDEREVVRMDTNTKNVIEPVSIATPGANSSHTNGNAQIKQSTSSFSGSQEHEGSHVSISFNNEKIPSANVNTSVGDSVHNVSASMTVDDVAQEVSVSRIPIIRNVSSSESSESPDKNDSPTKFVHLVDDHAETFRNHLHQQWLKAQYCDLTLRVKDNEVKVHSCVFSAFSPRGCQNERRKVVFLPDVSYSSVDALVRMMYTGILCFDAGEAAKVLHAAKELMMTEMVTLIQNYINQCPLPDSGIRISQKPSGGLSVSQSATPVQTTSQSGRQKRGRGRPRKSDKSESQSVSTPESVSPKRKRRATTFKDIVPGLSERVLRQHVPKDPPSEEFEIKIETEETDDDDGDEAFDETHGTSSEDTIVKQEIMDEEDEEVQEEEGDATETVGRAKDLGNETITRKSKGQKSLLTGSSAVPKKQIRKPVTSYDMDNLQKAVNDVKSGKFTILQASRHFGVPRTTIQDRVTGKREGIARRGRFNIISSDIEWQIVDEIKTVPIDESGFTRKQLGIEVGRVLNRLQVETPFKNGVPGKYWLGSFLQRHPDIKLRAPSFSRPARGIMLDPTENCEQQVNVDGSPSMILNADESSVSLIHNPSLT